MRGLDLPVLHVPLAGLGAGCVRWLVLALGGQAPRGRRYGIRRAQGAAVPAQAAGGLVGCDRALG